MPSHHARLARQQPTELLHADAALGGDEQHLVAHLAENASERLEVGRLHEVNLVDAKDGADAVAFRFDQHPVDEVRLEGRFSGARDDNHLVDVGHQHVLPLAAGAAEDAAPRFDPLDEAIFHAVLTEVDNVPCHDDMPLVGAHIFEDAARGTAKQPAIIRADLAGEAEDREDAAVQ